VRHAHGRISVSELCCCKSLRTALFEIFGSPESGGDKLTSRLGQFQVAETFNVFTILELSQRGDGSLHQVLRSR
jgi:hypothetical protein